MVEHTSQGPDIQITLEHTPRGELLPDWLREAMDDGAALLIIHAGDDSRRQAVMEMADGGPSDGTTLNPDIHHTIDSLENALVSDLRLPRPMNDDGILHLMEDSRLSIMAAELGFPLIHPDPTRSWHHSRSSRLAELHRRLVRSGTLGTWDGDPGAVEYDALLRQMEDESGRLHPALVRGRVIEELLRVEHTPFTLNGLSGIVMLDCPPTMEEQDIAFMRAISTHVPVHQLVHDGSFRLGEHGGLLEDLEPCRVEADLPDWVPTHRPTSDGERETSIHRLILQEGYDEVSAVHSILTSLEASTGGHGRSVIIVDGDVSRGPDDWSVILEESGYHVAASPKTARETPLVHSILRLLELGQGDDAWSPTRLIEIADVLDNLGDGWRSLGRHPEETSWHPSPDIETIREVSHSLQIRGGPHALSQWMRALSEPRFEHPWIPVEERRRTREETQWWIASLARMLGPWLDWNDETAIVDDSIRGCATGVSLPLPENPADCIAWFGHSLQWIDWAGLVERDTQGTGVLRQLFQAITRIEDSIPESRSWRGGAALDRFKTAFDDVQIRPQRIEDGQLRLMKPIDSLGCTADIIILVGTSASAWNLDGNNVPWMGIEDRLQLGVERPDKQMRLARHLIRSIISSGSEVLVLDTSCLESDPPAAHWMEILDEGGGVTGSSWLDPPSWMMDGDSPVSGWRLKEIEDGLNGLCHEPLTFITSGDGFEVEIHGYRQRDRRQRGGLSARRGEATVPAMGTSSLLGWEREIHSERLSRRPRSAEGAYLDEDEVALLVNRDDLDLLAGGRLPEETPLPRENPIWPVIGRVHEGRRRTPSVDIRPLQWSGTGLVELDDRMGVRKATERRRGRWSASRLHDWLDCPRKGWLKHVLKADGPEVMDDDMDGRLRGILVHDVLALTMAEAMSFEIGDINDFGVMPNLSASGLDMTEVMAMALAHSLTIAPWLRRDDAVAHHRRLSLLGLDQEQLLAWEDEEGQTPILLGGRLGSMIRREMKVTDTGLVSIERNIRGRGGRPRMLVPGLGEDEADVEFNLSGIIDRVEILRQGDSWTREEGVEEVVPLDLDQGQRDESLRHIVIKEIKTISGPSGSDSGKRHRKALLQEVQLALYARIWELENPGDRVVGVGVVEVGEDTVHYLEMDNDVISTPGNSSDEITSMVSPLHRRRNETPETLVSNPFRAWLRHRLEISSNVIESAENGLVNPTPGQKVCGYCPVSNSCSLSSLFEGGGH